MTRIYQSGKVDLPKAARQQTGIDAGDEVLIEARGRELVIRHAPAKQTATARSFHPTHTVLKPFLATADKVDGARLLEDLQEPDDLTLRFNPLGFGSRLAPEDSAAYYAYQIQLLMLPADVPEHIRDGFDRVRKVFIYGLLEYELFTASYALAHFVLEGALRTRFLDYYSGSIPITRDGVADTLNVTSFEDYRRALFAAARDDQRMRLQGSGKPLPRAYESLYAWARTQGLLPRTPARPAKHRRFRITREAPELGRPPREPHGHRASFGLPSTTRRLRDHRQALGP